MKIFVEFIMKKMLQLLSKKYCYQRPKSVRSFKQFYHKECFFFFNLSIVIEIYLSEKPFISEEYKTVKLLTC